MQNGFNRQSYPTKKKFTLPFQIHLYFSNQKTLLAGTFTTSTKKINLFLSHQQTAQGTECREH